MTLALGLSWDTLSPAKPAPTALSVPALGPSLLSHPFPLPRGTGSRLHASFPWLHWACFVSFFLSPPCPWLYPLSEEGRQDSSSCPTYPVLLETTIRQWVGTRWVGGVGWAGRKCLPGREPLGCVSLCLLPTPTRLQGSSVLRCQACSFLSLQPHPCPVPPATPLLSALCSPVSIGPGAGDGWPGMAGPWAWCQLCLCSLRRTLTRAGIRLLPPGMCQQLPRLRVL